MTHSSRLFASIATVGVLAGLCAAQGCTGTESKATTTSRDSASSANADDGGVTDADAPQPKYPCKGKANGLMCGSMGEHCIAGHCVVNSCGDGVKAGSEECDDGNQVLLDGCDPTCHKDKVICGDGRLGLGEECDDGNVVNDDACSNLCKKNQCGNGRVELREECDDGNTKDTDACSNTCTHNVCGNGRVDSGESCDDGNKNDNDGCTNACTTARCGNGTKEGKEECDDGNTVDDDACSNACSANVCGNQRIDPGEVCDGDVVGVTCAGDCKSLMDVCRPCEEANCRNFLGVDLVAGCYEDPDPAFVQKCVDALSCARAKNCAYTARGAEQCYCGTADSAKCQLGTGVDGVCKAQFEAAAGSTDPVIVTQNFGDLSRPVGNAVFMLQCDRDSCAAHVNGLPTECAP